MRRSRSGRGKHSTRMMMILTVRWENVLFFAKQFHPIWAVFIICIFSKLKQLTSGKGSGSGAKEQLGGFNQGLLLCRR